MDTQADLETLTAQQVSVRLGLSAKRTRVLIVEGKIPAVRYGKRGWRVPARALDAYFDQQAATALARTQSVRADGA